MLFFICIIILLSITVFLIIISELKVEVKNLKLSSLNANFIQDDYLIEIGLYIKNSPLLKLKLDKKKIENAKLNEKIKKMDLQKHVRKLKPQKEIFKRIKSLRINLEEINLNIKLDTIDPILTSYVTALISSIIGVLFGVLIRKYDKEKQKFMVEPVYTNKNLITLSLSCIIGVKIWNIIRDILNYRKLYLNDLKNTRVQQI